MWVLRVLRVRVRVIVKSLKIYPSLYLPKLKGVSKCPWVVLAINPESTQYLIVIMTLWCFARIRAVLSAPFCCRACRYDIRVLVKLLTLQGVQQSTIQVVKYISCL